MNRSGAADVYQIRWNAIAKISIKSQGAINATSDGQFSLCALPSCRLSHINFWCQVLDSNGTKNDKFSSIPHDALLSLPSGIRTSAYASRMRAFSRKIKLKKPSHNRSTVHRPSNHSRIFGLSNKNRHMQRTHGPTPTSISWNKCGTSYLTRKTLNTLHGYSVQFLLLCF